MPDCRFFCAPVRAYLDHATQWRLGSYRGQCDEHVMTSNAYRLTWMSYLHVNWLVEIFDANFVKPANSNGLRCKKMDVNLWHGIGNMSSRA